MVSPATGTMSLDTPQPASRLRASTEVQPRHDGMLAVDRQLQTRYGEAPGVLALGAANLLQRRMTRLAADHLPLWHLLQRRWFANAMPWAVAGDMPLVQRWSNQPVATAFGADAFFSTKSTTLPSAAVIPQSLPVTPTSPSAQATIARQPWPQTTLPADPPDQAQSTKQTAWGRAFLQRHLTGTASDNAPSLSRLSAAKPGARHFLAHVCTPEETTAHSATALGSSPVALHRSALATAHQAPPTIATRPPVTETVVQAAQPVTNFVEQTPLLVTRNVSGVAGEQGAAPMAQSAMTALPQPPSHISLPALLSADNLPAYTATGASTRGSVQRLSAPPAARFAEPGTATQTSTTHPVTDAASSSPVQPVARVQRTQAWGIGSGEVSTGKTTDSPTVPLTSSLSRAGDSVTVMGAPIVQRRRDARVRNELANMAQTSAPLDVQTPDAVVVQETAQPSTAGQRPPADSPAVQTAPIPSFSMVASPEHTASVPAANSASGQQASLVTPRLVPHTATMLQPAIIQRGSQRSNLGQRYQNGATQWDAPVSESIPVRRFDSLRPPVSVSGTPAKPSAGNDITTSAEIHSAAQTMPAVATSQPAYGDATAFALSLHELARSATADSSSLPGVDKMNATPALIQRNRGAQPSAAPAHPLTPATVQAERREQRELPPMPMRTDVERKQPSAPEAVVHSGPEQWGQTLLQRHVAGAADRLPPSPPSAESMSGASTALPVFHAEQTLLRQALSAREPLPAAVAHDPAPTAYPFLQPQRLADLEHALRATAVASTHTVEPPPDQPLAEPVVLEEGVPTRVEPPPMTFVQSLPSRPAPRLPVAEQAAPAGQGTAASFLPVSNRVTPIVAQRAVQSIATGQRPDAQRLPLSQTLLVKAQTASAAPAPRALPLRTLGTTLLQRYLGETSTPWEQTLTASPLSTNVDVGAAEPLPWLAPVALPQRALAAPSTPAMISDNHPDPTAQTYSQPPTLHRLATTIARATDEPTASVSAPSPLSTMTTPIAPATGPPPSAMAQIDVERLADRVYAIIEQRLVMERESMGL